MDRQNRSFRSGFVIFFNMKPFVIKEQCTLGLPRALFIPPEKKNPPRKKYLIFQEMELLSSNIKKIQETETLKKLLIFLETEPFSLSPKKINFLTLRLNQQQLTLKDAPAIFKEKRQKGNRRKGSDINFVFFK